MKNFFVKIMFYDCRQGIYIYICICDLIDTGSIIKDMNKAENSCPLKIAVN